MEQLSLDLEVPEEDFQLLEKVISDLVIDFIYCDRIEDEELNLERLLELEKEIPVDVVVFMFEEGIRKFWGAKL